MLILFASESAKFMDWRRNGRCLKPMAMDNIQSVDDVVRLVPRETERQFQELHGNQQEFSRTLEQS